MELSQNALSLSGRPTAAQGGRRHIFLRPDDDGVFVKVDRPEWTRKRGGWLKRLKRILLPNSDLRAVHAEAREARRTARRAARRGVPNPLPRFHGYVETDLGLATQHERLRAPDGSNARELRAIWVQAGRIYDADLIPPLEALMRQLLDLSVVVNDLHHGNIVVTQADGRTVMRLIDGYGDRAVIPLRTWFDAVNRRALHDRIARLGRKIGLRWDRRARRFVPAA